MVQLDTGRPGMPDLSLGGSKADGRVDVAQKQADPTIDSFRVEKEGMI